MAAGITLRVFLDGRICLTFNRNIVEKEPKQTGQGKLRKGLINKYKTKQRDERVLRYYSVHAFAG